MEKKYSILYAEDDIKIRKNYVTFLENYFDNIYEANNGQEALKIYKDKKPDVLLVDITMPIINGIDLVKSIREIDNETPIIILSAHSHKEYLFGAIKLNLVDYLIKPINRIEFKEVIESSIKKISKNLFSNEDEKMTIMKNSYWNKTTRLFFHKDRIVDLTKNERILFELLLSKKNQIVKPIDIASYVWDSKNTNVNDASIRNLVKRLRKKLPVDIVQSIYGSGYILNF
ncbi:MAG: DNA-binding response regulator [Arcobacter sp.]|nr:MAG: DNA-binding response regulator [Arcobacter sp.]